MIDTMNYRLNYYYLNNPEHCFYNETTLLVVLKGKMAVTRESEAVQLREGDCFILNINDRIEKTPLNPQEAVYVELAINSMFFASQYPAFFHTNFYISESISSVFLRKQVAELCLIDFTSDSLKKTKQTIALCQIILTLTQQFKKENTHGHSINNNQKVDDIITYIESHFAEQLDLHTVANVFFMSEPTLSKLFKRETGYFFSDYLRLIQIRHSVTELRYTKKSIENIAIDNGFKTTKTFRQQFKKIIGETPTTYRQKEHQQPTAAISTITQTKRATILAPLYRYADIVLNEELPLLATPERQQVTITSQTPTKLQKPGIIINIESLEYLSRKSIQADIRALIKIANIKYIGIHSLITEIPMASQLYKEERINAFPRFEELDTSFAFLDELNLELFYNFSLTAYRQRNQQETHYILEFIQHYNRTRKRKTQPLWHFNCLLDLNSLSENTETFKDVAHLLKKHLPSCQVGAEIRTSDPFTTDQTVYYTKIFIHCDFLSFVADPNHVFFNADNFKDKQSNQRYVIEKTRFIKQQMQHYGIDCPLYLTDWNTLTGNTRRSNGYFFRGAIIVNDLLALNHLVNGYGFWLNIEIYEKHGRSKKVQPDGLELFHYFSGKRPTFFSLELTQRLEGDIISQGDNYLFTVYNGHYQLLLWHTTYFNPVYSSEEIFVAGHAVSFAITLNHLKQINYQVKHLDFNRHHGALFYAYDKFQEAPSLDYETQTYINAATHLQLKNYRFTYSPKKPLSLTLDANAVVLLEFTPLPN